MLRSSSTYVVPFISGHPIFISLIISRDIRQRELGIYSFFSEGNNCQIIPLGIESVRPQFKAILMNSHLRHKLFNRRPANLTRWPQVKEWFRSHVSSKTQLPSHKLRWLSHSPQTEYCHKVDAKWESRPKAIDNHVTYSIQTLGSVWLHVGQIMTIAPYLRPVRRSGSL